MLATFINSFSVLSKENEPQSVHSGGRAACPPASALRMMVIPVTLEHRHTTKNNSILALNILMYLSMGSE